MSHLRSMCRVLAILAAALAAMLALAASLPAGAAAELRVCAACPYTTVQAAVDAAQPGDLIKVAGGVYAGVTARAGMSQAVYLSKTVTIRGGYAASFADPPDPLANPTVLDAQNLGRVIVVAGDISPRIEGLSITQGFGGARNGGGLFSTGAHPFISNCRFYNNWAQSGGAIYLVNSPGSVVAHTDVQFNGAVASLGMGGGIAVVSSADVALDGNRIEGNEIVRPPLFVDLIGLGGGVACAGSDGLLMTGNQVGANRAKWGGGVSLSTCAGARLTGNVVFSNTVIQSGGGLDIGYSDGATLAGNRVYANRADGGSSLAGGINLYQSPNAVLTGNSIYSNASGADGGGLFLWSSPASTLQDNEIYSNTAEEGGGGIRLYLSDGVAVTGNRIYTNTARTSRGGGVFLNDSRDVAIDGNQIYSNTAGQGGGGIALYSCAANTLSRNRIYGNRAGQGGGGIDFASQGRLENNWIADNRLTSGAGAGARIGWFSSHCTTIAQVLHTTVARNTGGDGSGIAVDGGVWAPISVALTNTLLASHTVGIMTSAATTLTLNSTLWASGAWANRQAIAGDGRVISDGNRTGDPAFVNPGAGDYRIGAASAARDAAVDAGLRDDVDGQLRPMGLGPDLGAAEYADAGLAIQPSPLLRFVNRGQSFTYTIRLSNPGPAGATGVVFTGTLDGWQRPVSSAASAGSCAITGGGPGGGVVCSLGALAAGAGATVTIAARVEAGAPPRQAMVSRFEAAAPQARNRVPDTTYAQDCHVRIDDGATEYTLVQAAVDAATLPRAGQPVVKVAGVCVGAWPRGALRQQVYLDKSVTLRGGYTVTDWLNPDPAGRPAELDALGQGRVIYAAGSGTPALEGLRISGGNAAGQGGRGRYNAGGGIFAAVAALSLRWDQVVNNTAPYYGGGLYAAQGSVSLESSRFTANSATSAPLNGMRNEGSGGGLFVDLDARASLQGSVLVSNTAWVAGGALFARNAPLAMTNTVVAGNHAWVGSGVYLAGSQAVLAHTTLAGNAYDDSQGSGIYIAEAGGDWSIPPSGAVVTLTNTIVAGHASGVVVDSDDYGVSSTVKMDGSLWGSGSWANGKTVVQIDSAGGGPQSRVITANNTFGDPAFAAPALGDYHIQAASAAVDRGISSDVANDMDNQLRPNPGAGIPDLGADEWWAACTAAGQVGIRGPQQGRSGGLLAFTAVVTPADATPHITYLWSPEPRTGQGTATAGIVFDRGGAQMVGVVAANCGTSRAASAGVTLDYGAYLPMARK